MSIMNGEQQGGVFHSSPEARVRGTEMPLEPYRVTKVVRNGWFRKHWSCALVKWDSSSTREETKREAWARDTL